VRHVVIVGLGLIGGSFALALRKAGFTGTITGVSSVRSVQAAFDLGVIDRAAPLAEAVREGDLVLLSQPISGILETLQVLDPLVKEGALVTDAGSTKREIVESASRLFRRTLFLGGHPMAGKESRGVQAADPDLFVGRTWLLAPIVKEDLESPQVVEFISWIKRIAAIPMPISPRDHDNLVAFTSHLPQLASTALAYAVQRAVPAEKVVAGSGPGLSDMTRLAQSDFEIWGDIIRTNRDRVEMALDTYISLLHEMRNSLGSPSLEEFFAAASKWARILRGASHG